MDIKIYFKTLTIILKVFFFDQKMKSIAKSNSKLA